MTTFDAIVFAFVALVLAASVTVAYADDPRIEIPPTETRWPCE